MGKHSSKSMLEKQSNMRKLTEVKPSNWCSCFCFCFSFYFLPEGVCGRGAKASWFSLRIICFLLSVPLLGDFKPLLVLKWLAYCGLPFIVLLSVNVYFLDSHSTGNWPSPPNILMTTQSKWVPHLTQYPWCEIFVSQWKP